MPDTVIIIAAQDEATDALKQLGGTFKSAGQDIESGFGSSLQTVTGYMTQFLAAAGIGGGIAGIYALGAEWEATVFKMEAVFGAGAEHMLQTAQALSEKCNDYFSTVDFANAFAKVADTLDQMGLTGEQQMGVVAAAADIAAVRGLNLEETVTGITKALGGAGRAGLQYGLSLKDNYMETVAFGGALKDVWISLSATDKEALRYQEFLLQVGKYSGDVAEKSKTMGGSLHALANDLKEAMTPGGPQSQWGSILGDIPVLGPMLQSLAEIWGWESKISAEMVGQKSAQAAVNNELSDALSTVDKLAAAAANYQGRMGTEQEADKQREISVELAKQGGLQQQIKALETDRANETKSLAALEQQLEYLRSTNTGDLYTDNFAQQQDTLGKIRDAKIKISQDDAAILQKEQAISSSMQAQDQLAWDKASALAAQAQKMAYTAASTGTTSEFNSPAYHKDITALLNDQADAQKKIITLEAQRSTLEQSMQQSAGFNPQAYAAQAQQLETVNTQLDFEKSQVSYISDVLKGLEQVRLKVLPDSIDFTKVQNQAAEVQNAINILHEVKPSFDTSAMEAQLKDLTDKINDFKANAEKALASMGSGDPLSTSGVSLLGTQVPQVAATPVLDMSQVQDMSLESAKYGEQAAKSFTDGWSSIIKNMPFAWPVQWTTGWQSEIDSANARFESLVTTVKQADQLPVTLQFWGEGGSEAPLGEEIQKFQNEFDALRADISQGATFTVQMMMAMSPAVPFSEGMADLQGYFARVPQNMYTTINMAMEGGDTLSQALAEWQAILKYQPIISTMNAEIQVAGASMSGMLYAAAMINQGGARAAGVDFSTLEYSKEAAKAFIANNQLQYLEAVAALQQAAPQAGASTGTGTTASGTSAAAITNQSGVNINCAVTINVGQGATPMDTAITIATQLDSQLAGMVLAKRSQLVAAFQQMGLVKSS